MQKEVNKYLDLAILLLLSVYSVFFLLIFPTTLSATQIILAIALPAVVDFACCRFEKKERLIPYYGLVLGLALITAAPSPYPYMGVLAMALVAVVLIHLSDLEQDLPFAFIAIGLYFLTLGPFYNLALVNSCGTDHLLLFIELLLFVCLYIKHSDKAVFFLSSSIFFILFFFFQAYREPSGIGADNYFIRSVQAAPLLFFYITFLPSSLLRASIAQQFYFSFLVALGYIFSEKFFGFGGLYASGLVILLIVQADRYLNSLISIKRAAINYVVVIGLFLVSKGLLYLFSDPAAPTFNQLKFNDAYLAEVRKPELAFAKSNSFKNWTDWMLSRGTSISVYDLDQDGWQDLVLSQPLDDEKQLQIFFNKKGLFLEKGPDNLMLRQTLHKDGEHSLGSRVFDFDLDGDIDIYNLVGFGNPQLLVNRFDQIGEIRFRKEDISPAKSTGMFPLASTYIDFNLDQELDLLQADLFSSKLWNIYGRSKQVADNQTDLSKTNIEKWLLENKYHPYLWLGKKDGYSEAELNKLLAKVKGKINSIAVLPTENKVFTDIYFSDEETVGEYMRFSSKSGKEANPVYSARLHTGRVISSWGALGGNFDPSDGPELIVAAKEGIGQNSQFFLGRSYNLSNPDSARFIDYGLRRQFFTVSDGTSSSYSGDLDGDNVDDFILDRKVHYTSAKTLKPVEGFKALSKDGLYTSYVMSDFDNDGDRDILEFSSSGLLALHRNSLNPAKWIGLDLYGNGKNCNSLAIGSKITVLSKVEGKNLNEDIQVLFPANNSNQGDKRILITLPDELNEVELLISWCQKLQTKYILPVNQYHYLAQASN